MSFPNNLDARYTSSIASSTIWIYCADIFSIRALTLKTIMKVIMINDNSVKFAYFMYILVAYDL